eukprot:2324846-Alexandrium_andersonii.AAC.1
MPEHAMPELHVTFLECAPASCGPLSEFTLDSMTYLAQRIAESAATCSNEPCGAVSTPASGARSATPYHPD